MKRLFGLLAALSFAVCFLSAAAYAENLVEIERTGRNIAYVDADSVKDEGSYVTAATKIMIRTSEERARFKEKSGVDAHYVLLYFAYDKGAKRDQLLDVKSVYGYETTGSEKREFSADAWRDVPPGSLGEKVYEWVMAEAEK